MTERLNELYQLTQKAQKMERINEELALKIYLEIFENYDPIISKTFESTIHLLEKRHRYKEALEICNRAIDGIEKDQMSGIKDKFVSNKERILRKLAEQEPEPHESTPKKRPIKLKTVLILLGIVLIVGVILRLSDPLEVYVNLEGKESLDNEFFTGSKEGADSEEETFKDYALTQGMLDIASTEAERNVEVTDVTISPQNENIGLGLLVSLGTSEARAKEIAIDTLKSLSGAASAEYKSLSAPSANSFGGLYDYYEVIVTVGYGTDEDSFIVKGTKARNQDDIFWRQNTDSPQ